MTAEAGFGIARALGVHLGALRARRARARREGPAYRDRIREVLALAFPGGGAGGSTGFGGLDGAVSDCKPIGHTYGGFFCCIAVTDTGRRYFAKCGLADGREARFWRAWQLGAVREGGRYYRLVPPVAMVATGFVSIIVFPELRVARAGRKGRKLRYGQQIDHVVRAIADFNSDHVAPDESLLRVSRDCDRHSVPRRAEVARAMAVDEDRAGEMVRALRCIEPRWNAVRDRIYRASRCLCHMDLGPGNISVQDGIGIIQDFGHAATAPVGSDLHTVVRYAGSPGAAARDRLVESYAGVFAEKGMHLDAGVVRLALDAHFAARYRDVRLPSARRPEVFEEALATSLALL